MFPKNQIRTLIGAAIFSRERKNERWREKGGEMLTRVNRDFGAPEVERPSNSRETKGRRIWLSNFYIAFLSPESGREWRGMREILGRRAGFMMRTFQGWTLDLPASMNSATSKNSSVISRNIFSLYLCLFIWLSICLSINGPLHRSICVYLSVYLSTCVYLSFLSRYLSLSCLLSSLSPSTFLYVSE